MCREGLRRHLYSGNAGSYLEISEIEFASRNPRSRVAKSCGVINLLPSSDSPCFLVVFVVLLAISISFDLAEYTADVDGVGTLRLLDAVKTCGLINSVRFYQASTSELYGKVQEIPQKETTPFYPRSPYGANFVTRKISRSVAKIHLGQLECFSLGNLDAKRDWGHAKDYVERAWLLLLQTLLTPRPGQPVTPTREFCPLKKEQERDASRDAVVEQQAFTYKLFQSGKKINGIWKTCQKNPTKMHETVRSLGLRGDCRVISSRNAKRTSAQGSSFEIKMMKTLFEWVRGISA
ncbi:hypothetical protein FD754_006887 [Muntiacus muntjak]|uniref:GDP-mannose 4,6-dehydratase n=1 Tax=Muntiacus muntjak TaxID=9888 RepID=A0A5N3WLY3_MUNMU|nr:hypothetical protein FD754_006887 [Muntiacus muntjak]